MRYILDSHSHICCPPETNYVGVLENLLTNEASKTGLEAMGYDEAHIIAKIRELCIYFWGNYALAKGKPRWADKSTTYVDHIEFIEQLFPEAQFIFIYRHGLDQTHSLTHGGKYLDAAITRYHQDGQDFRLAGIQYWVEKTQKMLAFEKAHPHKSFHIRYEDLCNSPASQLKALFQFLQEPWEDDVLRFYEFEHDKGPEHGRTVVTRGFSISKDKYLTWDSSIIEQCAELASPTLAALEYTI